LRAPMKNGGTEISTKDPVAAVRQYIDGFNKGDAKVMAATFAVPGEPLTPVSASSASGVVVRVVKDTMIRRASSPVDHGPTGTWVINSWRSS
jgi:hypothetical protein